MSHSQVPGDGIPGGIVSSEEDVKGFQGIWTSGVNGWEHGNSNVMRENMKLSTLVHKTEKQSVF